MVRATVVALVSLVAGALVWTLMGGRVAPSWSEPLALLIAGVSMCAGSVLFLPREAAAMKHEKAAPVTPTAVQPQRATA